DKNFLQPKKDSPLATQGAGTEDPGLPTYVGAVTPEGAEPWNWQWTWDAFMNKTLTVSRDGKHHARFNKISAALDRVLPGMTVRVLDSSVYAEQLNIVDATRHKGVTLEAVQGATIAMAPAAAQVLKIENVSGLTVKGFHLHSEKHAQDGVNRPQLSV